jgi:hypothetical protein
MIEITHRNADWGKMIVLLIADRCKLAAASRRSVAAKQGETA